MAKSLLRQSVAMARSQVFNLDNGSGTTVDEALFKASSRGARLVRVYALYDEACQTVAGGNFKLGSAVGGAGYVAATAYTNSAAIGDQTAAVIVADAVPANGTVFVRHTGVAATQTGTAKIVVEYVDNE